jgi:hypothetical protein
MNKKTALIPGVFMETCNSRGLTTIEGIVEKVLIANGYPVVGNTCNQPDICDLLTDCDLGGGGGISSICALNGLSGTGLEGDCATLGGVLIQVTDIVTDAYDFSVTKDNVKLDINDAGGTLGAGEVARFYGTNGTIIAESGVFTNGGGAPTVASRVYNSGDNFYAIQAVDTTLERIIYNVATSTNSYLTSFVMTDESVLFGLTGITTTTFNVEKFTFTGGTDIIKLVGLPTFANNAAAAAASLPVDSLYKTGAGALMIVV